MPRSSLSGISILVVDDDDDIVDLVATVLRRAGARVLEASGATSAVDVLEHAGGADAIISDLMMPVTDGFSLLAILRSQTPFELIPAIALSGGGKALLERALKAGFQRVESKPISPERLVSSVVAVLAAAHAPWPRRASQRQA